MVFTAKDLPNTRNSSILEVKHLINGELISSNTSKWLDNCNPATQEVLSQVPLATIDEVNRAIESAKCAYLQWKEIPIMERARVFLRLQSLLRENLDDIAKVITEEQGKIFEDARGDVIRGIEVVEYAAGIPTLLMGETVENVGKEIDTYSYHQPLGVVAGITPFNFPAMIPLWMFPIAIAAGNTFVLKPSEQDPMTPMVIAELAHEAGLPKGVLNVIHGAVDVVNALLEHEDIQAISFVGSVKTGHHVFNQGTQHGKRVQALLGAKNHAVVMPDANKEKTLNAIVGAAFGASGQRCMALSVVVFVEESHQWITDLVDKAKALKVGPGDKNNDVGPLISPEAKQRVSGLIQNGVDEGAHLLLDGRLIIVPGYERGNFIGPTVFSNVKTTMKIYQEEIFGPVLLVVEATTLDEAIEFVNANPYGNGSCIFTESGQAARHFQHHIAAGQVGINIPIPVPLPFFSFTGSRGSIRGDLHAYGKHAVRFYTQTKTITSRWFGQEGGGKVNTTIQVLN